MNLNVVENNLARSIGQTRQPINETLGMCVNRLQPGLRIILLLFCISFSAVFARTTIVDDVEQVKEVLELLLKMTSLKILEVQQQKPIQELKVGKIALSNYGMWNSLAENQEKINRLTAVESSQAEELIQWIFEHYKLLFCFYCLKSSQSILKSKGGSVLSAVECFYAYLWSEEKNSFPHKQEKARFIKVAMAFVDSIENGLTHLQDVYDRNKFMGNLVKKFHPILPECSFELGHSLDSCQRCSALSVLDMIALGAVEGTVKKMIPEKPFFPLFFRRLCIAGLVVGAVWFFRDPLLRGGRSVGHLIRQGIDFIKKHYDFT